MNTELEQLLAQELSQVADEVTVPALPSLADDRPRASHRWLPVLVAALVAAIVAGVFVGVRALRDDGEQQPVETPKGLSTQRPTVAYVEDGVLWDGQKVRPGRWLHVVSRGDAWVAERQDGAWFWDISADELGSLDGLEGAPVLSADGRYLAWASRRDPGHVEVMVAETREGGEGLGTRVFTSGPIDREDHLGVVAVTNTGSVVLQSILARLLWHPNPNTVVDLTKTTDQWSHGGSPAGLLWGTQGSEAVYIGDVDDQGRVTRKVDLPETLALPDALAVYAVTGTKARPPLEDGLLTYGSALVSRLDTGTRRSIEPPRGWSFMRFDWEGEDRFLAGLADADGRQRTARCGVTVERCVLLPQLRGGAATASIPTGLPAVPYVENGVLRDGDVVVPGEWKFVIARGDTWVALREDGTWFRLGSRGEPEPLRGLDQEPVLSPNGTHLATARLVDGNIEVDLVTTGSSNDLIGVRTVPSGTRDEEDWVQLAGVTDSGLVILTSVAWNAPRIWDPRENGFVDTAGVLEGPPAYSTPGGLVWMDQNGANAFVGDVDGQGRVTSGTSLPHAQVVPNSGATYGFAEGELGSFAEQSVIETMVVHDLVKTGNRTVLPPQGWHFLGGGFQWEDGTHFLAWVLGDGDEQRTARCSVAENRCVLVDRSR